MLPLCIRNVRFALAVLLSPVVAVRCPLPASMQQAPPLLLRRRQLAGTTAAAVAAALPTALCAATDPAGWERAEQRLFGASVLERVEKIYSVDFALLLARWLLTHDAASRAWWKERGLAAKQQAEDLEPGTWSNKYARRAAAERSTIFVESSFESFVTSVEVGLESFSADPAAGATILLSRLKPQAVSNEARMQLAQAFSLLDPSVQPVAAISRLIAAVDNAKALNVTLNSPLGGYVVGEKPEVRVDDEPSLYLPCTFPVPSLNSPLGGYVVGEKPEVRNYELLTTNY
jgi:hypothetical protein